jgi:hypothetical protein
MSTHLENYAIDIAAKTTGVQPDVVRAGMKVGAFDWMMIISMIMEAVMKFMEQCNQPKPTLLASIKNPNRLQKARFYNIVRDSFDDQRAWGWRRRAREFADTMMDELPPDSDIEAIVAEVRGGF